MLLTVLLHVPARLRTFVPGEITIRRQVGSIGFATETEWQYEGRRNPLDPSQPARTLEASGTSVRLFDAEFSGRRILLKEYMGDVDEIGKNELRVYEHLYAQRAEGSGPPVEMGTMLGQMRSDSSFEDPAFIDEWLAMMPRTPPPAAGNLWTVFAWEGLQTVAAFPRRKQEREWWDISGQAALAQRCRFLRVVVSRSLEALCWLHGRGVVHRSLSGSSLLLNTLDQREAGRALVKMTDFGFAAIASELPANEVLAAMRRADAGPLQVLSVIALNDLHQFGYVMLELILNSLAEGGAEGGAAVEQAALKRLVEDVFSDDMMDGFRGYCAEDPAYAAAVGLLDEHDRAGWALLQQLIDCHKPEAASRVSAQALLESEWLRV